MFRIPSRKLQGLEAFDVSSTSYIEVSEILRLVYFGLIPLEFRDSPTTLSLVEMSVENIVIN